MSRKASLLEVDVQEGQHVRAGQQRRADGQLRQELPVHLLHLQHVPPGEGAQERPKRGRRADTAKQRGHGAVAQQIHVLDVARPGGHPGHQAGHLHLRVHPARPAEPDMLPHQAAQARPLGEGHHRDQARLRHQMRVIKRRVDLRQLMQQSHLRGVLSAGYVEVSATPIVPVQRAPSASTCPDGLGFPS